MSGPIKERAAALASERADWIMENKTTRAALIRVLTRDFEVTMRDARESAIVECARAAEMAIESLTHVDASEVIQNLSEEQPASKNPLMIDRPPSVGQLAAIIMAVGRFGFGDLPGKTAQRDLAFGEAERIVESIRQRVGPRQDLACRDRRGECREVEIGHAYVSDEDRAIDGMEAEFYANRDKRAREKDGKV